MPKALSGACFPAEDFGRSLRLRFSLCCFCCCVGVCACMRACVRMRGLSRAGRARPGTPPPRQSPETRRPDRSYYDRDRDRDRVRVRDRDWSRDRGRNRDDREDSDDGLDRLPIDDLFVLQARLKELQAQLILKESSLAEEAATSQHGQVCVCVCVCVCVFVWACAQARV